MLHFTVQETGLLVDNISRRTVMFDNIDWHAVAEALKTENLIKFASSTDPVNILKNPYFWGPAAIICIALFFMKFRKTLSVFIGSVILWVACFYLLPRNGELELHHIGAFGGIFVGVFGFWIYMFLLRSD